MCCHKPPFSYRTLSVHGHSSCYLERRVKFTNHVSVHVSQSVNINGLNTNGYEQGSRTKIVVNFSRPYAACEPERGVLDAQVRGESCGVSIGGPMGMCPMSRSIIRLAEM